MIALWLTMNMDCGGGKYLRLTSGHLIISFSEIKFSSYVQFSKSSFPKPVLQTKSPVLQTMTHLCPVLQTSSVLQTNRKTYKFRFLKV